MLETESQSVVYLVSSEVTWFGSRFPLTVRGDSFRCESSSGSVSVRPTSSEETPDLVGDVGEKDY